MESEKLYTKKDLELILKNLLEHPDAIIDYIENENTQWDVESLLDLVIE